MLAETFSRLAPAPLARAAYHAQHASIRVPLIAVQNMLRRFARREIRVSAAQYEYVARRYFNLLRRDLDNAEMGLYPKDLLFQFPMVEYARTVPDLIWEFQRAFRRYRKDNYKDLPRSVDLSRYPPYFRRNFHWQTDGYLSRRSAEIYDAGVELVFLGTADVMRRQIIPPITHFLNRAHDGPARILDVASGTGRTLLQLAQAHPGHKFFALDLSPFYLQVARDTLRDVPDVSFVADNGEQMPFKAGTFDVVSSVYLFHELPKNARARVINEMFRVLRPGGLCVIQDSAQLVESPGLQPFLTGFSGDLHEPFFEDYIADDLAAHMRAAGFEVQSVEPCYVAKTVVARRPAAS